MTEIQWTDETWNPVTGCTKVSPGCAHCYAEGVANRFWAKQYPPISLVGAYVDDAGPASRPRLFTDVQCHEDRLDQPLRWKKPRKVFVNSMSDLFHEDVPDAFIDRVFAVMALAPQHTFQILTKRAERMLDYMAHADRPTLIARQVSEMPLKRRYTWEEARSVIFGIKLSEEPPRSRWPLPNVWLGVSVENQRFADERIPLLLQTPAAIRFISAEPLLGPVDLMRIPSVGDDGLRGSFSALHGVIAGYAGGEKPRPAIPRLDWIIVGGESGAGARPFDVAWARAIVSQCQDAGVPVFVKQLGAAPLDSTMSETRCSGKVHYRQPVGSERDVEHRQQIADGRAPAYVVQSMRLDLRDRKGGDMAEWPADLRVREFPA